MIYKFRIISDEAKEFAREILINSDQTFLDFHHCLQADLGFDPKQLASFFTTDSNWEKKLQITLIDMMDDESGNCVTMDGAKLGTYISVKGQRLLYVFDFFSERSFFIELTDILEIEKHRELPKISFRNGDPPEQINLGLDNLDIPDDFGEDLYGNGPDEDLFGDLDNIEDTHR